MLLFFSQQVKFTLEQDIKAQRGVGCQRHAPAALPLEKRPDTHCTGSWVDPRAGLERCRKSPPHQNMTPQPPSL
jgi:hypothetical protein